MKKIAHLHIIDFPFLSAVNGIWQSILGDLVEQYSA